MAPAALFLVLILLAFIGLRTPGSHRSNPRLEHVPGRTGGRAQRPTKVPVPTIEHLDDTDTKPAACGDPTLFRDRFEAASSACHDELVAAGCTDPLARYTDQEEDQLRSEALNEILERCPADVVNGIELDCAHIPCMVLARSDTAEAASQCLAAFAPVPARQAVNGWKPIAWSHREDERMFVFFRPAIERRLDQRLTRLEHALERGLRTSDIAQSTSCEAQAQMLSEPVSCDLVRTTLGCTPDPDTSLPLEDVEDYLEQTMQLIDDHAEDCAGFAASDWHLDCSDVPCVLVIRGIQGEADTDFKTLGCQRGWWRNAITQDTNTEAFGRLTTVTVWGEWGDHDGMRSRYDRWRTARYIRAIHAGLPAGSGVWQ